MGQICDWDFLRSAHRAKMKRKMVFKSFRSIPFGANLTQSEAKSDIPGLIQQVLLELARFFLCVKTEKSSFECKRLKLMTRQTLRDKSGVSNHPAELTTSLSSHRISSRQISLVITQVCQIWP